MSGGGDLLPKLVPISFSGVHLVFELFRDTWHFNTEILVYAGMLPCPLMAPNYANLYTLSIPPLQPPAATAGCRAPVLLPPQAEENTNLSSGRPAIGRALGDTPFLSLCFVFDFLAYFLAILCNGLGFVVFPTYSPEKLRFFFRFGWGFGIEKMAGTFGEFSG